ncbi:hypothetical protein Trydic_g19921, partial [Trypoxylus dichotomus]
RRRRPTPVSRRRIYAVNDVRRRGVAAVQSAGPVRKRAPPYRTRIREYKSVTFPASETDGRKHVPTPRIGRIGTAIERWMYRDADELHRMKHYATSPFNGTFPDRKNGHVALAFDENHLARTGYIYMRERDHRQRPYSGPDPRRPAGRRGPTWLRPIGIVNAFARPIVFALRRIESSSLRSPLPYLCDVEPIYPKGHRLNDDGRARYPQSS